MSDPDDSSADVDDPLADVDDAISETFDLRRGGTLAYGTDHVYVARHDGKTVQIALENVVEVQHNPFDWFLAILSVVLTGFGLFYTQRSVPGGLGFAVVGLASMYLTYRKRDALSFKVSGRAKPLDLYLDEAEAAYEALRPLMAEE